MTEQHHQRTEQENHRKAFEMYFALGEKRSYRQIAQQLGVSLPTIKNWAKKCRWQILVAERDAEVGRQLADRTLQAARTSRERRRKVIELVLIKLTRAIAEDRVKLRATDLDRLIRLEQYLDECEGNRKPETPEEIVEFFDEWDEETYRAVVRLYDARRDARAKRGEEPQP